VAILAGMIRKAIKLGFKVVGVASAVAMSACKSTPPTKIDVTSRPTTGKTGVVGLEGIRGFASLSSADLDALRSKKVFFGHQSVGQNLIDGARAIGFPFSHVEDGASFATVSWGDAKIDKNGDPLRKFTSFKTLIADKGIGAKVDVATMKLCWIDFESGTDVGSLLAKYDADVQALRAANPKLQLLHMTPPLTTSDPGLNAVRWKFGRAMIDKYRTDGLIFDLAEVIATGEDGTLCEKRGAPRLCDGWSSDEGHLNDAGSQRAAKAFVAAVKRLVG